MLVVQLAGLVWRMQTDIIIQLESRRENKVTVS